MVDASQAGSGQPVSLSVAGAEARACELLKKTDDLVRDFIMNHPFTQRLEEQSLPIEAIRAANLDWYVFHREMAASFSRLYKRFVNICRTHVVIEEEYLERISHELTRPKAGGRTLLLRKLLLALDVPEAKINEPSRSVDLRGLVAYFGRLHSEGTFAEVVAGQIGSALEPYARLWRDALTRQCGLGAEAVQYWEMNCRLGQDKDGGGALGTRQENALLLRQAFEHGLTETRFNWSMEYAAE
ncbi:MAG TPA: hypothetical protein VGB25_08075, partial [Candidatus Binatia bacterium]